VLGRRALAVLPAANGDLLIRGLVRGERDANLRLTAEVVGTARASVELHANAEFTLRVPLADKRTATSDEGYAAVALALESDPSTEVVVRAIGFEPAVAPPAR
jgi:hypothetical protein